MDAVLQLLFQSTTVGLQPDAGPKNPLDGSKFASTYDGSAPVRPEPEGATLAQSFPDARQINIADLPRTSESILAGMDAAHSHIAGMVKTQMVVANPGDLIRVAPPISPLQDDLDARSLAKALQSETPTGRDLQPSDHDWMARQRAEAAGEFSSDMSNLMAHAGPVPPTQTAISEESNSEGGFTRFDFGTRQTAGMRRDPATPEFLPTKAPATETASISHGAEPSLSPDRDPRHRPPQIAVAPTPPPALSGSETAMVETKTPVSDGQEKSELPNSSDEAPSQTPRLFGENSRHPSLPREGGSPDIRSKTTRSGPHDLNRARSPAFSSAVSNKGGQRSVQELHTARIAAPQDQPRIPPDENPRSVDSPVQSEPARNPQNTGIKRPTLRQEEAMQAMEGRLRIRREGETPLSGPGADQETARATMIRRGDQTDVESVGTSRKGGRSAGREKTFAQPSNALATSPNVDQRSGMSPRPEGAKPVAFARAASGSGVIDRQLRPEQVPAFNGGQLTAPDVGKPPPEIWSNREESRSENTERLPKNQGVPTVPAAPITNLDDAALAERSDRGTPLDPVPDTPIQRIETNHGPTPDPRTPTSQTPTTKAEHIVAQVVHRITTLTDRDAPMELTLDPPELGSIRVSVSRGPEGMLLHMQADSPDTLDLLRRHSAALTQELQRQGLDQTGFSFSGRNEGEQRPVTPMHSLPPQDEIATDNLGLSAPPASPSHSSGRSSLDIRL